MSDLDIATAAVADEAGLLTQLLAQLAAGDPNARPLLTQELGAAREARAYYVAGVPGLDTTILDHAISQAAAALGMGVVPASGAMFSAQGVRLGNTIVPWAVVLALGVVAWVVYREGKR